MTKGQYIDIIFESRVFEAKKDEVLRSTSSRLLLLKSCLIISLLSFSVTKNCFYDSHLYGCQYGQ